ncbi:threonine/serine dehydratase [Actinoplanes sp. NPDC049599]|uniref:threonine/serine dehydratase n=1 Tax=Actinoplanes sp. NPDC049599 TaxID=3363903 RepID=UPI00378B553E
MDLRFADVTAARPIVDRHLSPTPLSSYPALDLATGATVLVKHENAQPVGAFKVRGGLTLLAGLSAAERARGTVSYSTGNHARSLAYASKVYGAPCTVVMPAAAAPAKAAAVAELGAEVILHGADLEAAQHHAEALAERTGARLVSPGDTPELLAGVGTLYLEIFEARPDIEVLFVPVGSGTGAGAATVVARELAPACQVIAVQSEQSRAAHDSWRSGTLERRPNRTRVDGLATGRGFALPQQLLRAGLADFVLVTDDEVSAAQRLLAETADTVAEGAGAAALAGLLARPDLCRGRRVAVVCTGGNATDAERAALGAA